MKKVTYDFLIKTIFGNGHIRFNVDWHQWQKPEVKWDNEETKEFFNSRAFKEGDMFGTKFTLEEDCQPQQIDFMLGMSRPYIEFEMVKGELSEYFLGLDDGEIP